LVKRRSALESLIQSARLDVGVVVSAFSFSPEKGAGLACPPDLSFSTLADVWSDIKKDATSKNLCLVGAGAALRRVHSNGFVHGNLTPDHIFVDESNRLFLTDFHYCHRGHRTPIDWEVPLQVKGMSVPPETSTYYWSPELFMNPDSYDPARDVFSFGVLMYSLLSQGPLSANIDAKKVSQPTAVNWKDFILDGNRFKYDPRIPKLHWQLITSCLAADPQQRPSADAIVDILCSSDAILKKADVARVTALQDQAKAKIEAGSTLQ
jgi:serine/threonine protein kinase